MAIDPSVLGEWEFDFQNPPILVPEIPPPAQCLHCQQSVAKPFYVVRNYPLGQVRHLPFCSEEHHQEYYLNKLRHGL